MAGNIPDAVKPRRKRRLRIEVLIGSESDLPQVQKALDILYQNANVRSQIMSCDRNPDKVRNFAKRYSGADLVIAAAGESARLCGDVKSWLCFFGHSDVPVLGVALEGKTELASLAAKLAIMRIPNQPVNMPDPEHAYFGANGFMRACMDALQKKIEPKNIVFKPSRVIKDWDQNERRKARLASKKSGKLRPPQHGYRLPTQRPTTRISRPSGTNKKSPWHGRVRAELVRGGRMPV